MSVVQTNNEFSSREKERGWAERTHSNRQLCCPFCELQTVYCFGLRVPEGVGSSWSKSPGSQRIIKARKSEYLAGFVSSVEVCPKCNFTILYLIEPEDRIH